jgi:hypothetical protein
VRIPPRFVPIAVVLSLVGCGSGGDTKAPQQDEEAIAGLVADAAEKCSAPQPAKELFVTAPDKATLKRYAGLTFETAGRASVSGTTATAQVKVFDPQGKELGQVEWKFVKQGERWKLESAPLP